MALETDSNPLRRRRSKAKKKVNTEDQFKRRGKYFLGINFLNSILGLAWPFRQIIISKLAIIGSSVTATRDSNNEDHSVIDQPVKGELRARARTFPGANR